MPDQYTPSMKQIEEDWISLMITSDGYSDALPEEMAQEQWNRALAAHDALVAAAALRDAAAKIAAGSKRQTRRTVELTLLAEADRIERGTSA
jgi:hypothetical protein